MDRNEIIEKWKQQFHNNLYIEMENKKITQRELSKKAGVTEVTISRWMNGSRIPKITDVMLLAMLLECPLSLLAGMDNEDSNVSEREKMNDLNKAIKMVQDEYERALKLNFVKNPIAYALYHTWKKFDGR